MSWEDIKDDIVKTAVETFGQAATFRPQSGPDVAITVMFSRQWVEMKVGAGVAVSGFHSIADVRIADLPSTPGNGDKLIVDAVEFKIVDYRDEGGGGARLVLKK